MSRATYIYNHACGRCGGDGAAPPPADEPGGDQPPAVPYPGTTAHMHPLFGRPAAVDPVLRAVIEEQRAAFADVAPAATGGGG